MMVVEAAGRGRVIPYDALGFTPNLFTLVVHTILMDTKQILFITVYIISCFEYKTKVNEFVRACREVTKLVTGKDKLVAEMVSVVMVELVKLETFN